MKNRCGFYVLILLLLILLSTVGCGRKEPLNENTWLQTDIADGDLSTEVLKQYNSVFKASFIDTEGITQATEISCFFTSFYKKVEDIDLEEFLKYCPLRTQVVDEEEFQEVSEAACFDLGSDNIDTMPSPIWKYPKKKVDALLLKYAGITTANLSWKPNASTGLIYVESRDAYYNLTSDFGPGSFFVSKGEKNSNYIVLEDSKGSILTISINGNNPQIVSFTKSGCVESSYMPNNN